MREAGKMIFNSEQISFVGKKKKEIWLCLYNKSKAARQPLEKAIM